MPHLLEVFVHAGGQCSHLVGELGQRGGVAFGELADAAGEGLKGAVKLALNCGGEGGQPFVVHDEGLDVGLGVRGVFRINERLDDLGVDEVADAEFIARGPEGRIEVGFLDGHLSRSCLVKGLRD